MPHTIAASLANSELRYTGGRRQIHLHEKPLMYNANLTVRYIEESFPHLAEDLHEPSWDGLLHLQVAVFSRFAQQVIDNHEVKQWGHITQVFQQLWRDCSQDVTNALNVSFLEHLNFSDGRKRRSWAYRSMPQQMQVAWQSMDEYNRKLHGG